jgi:hypothetical protein
MVPRVRLTTSCVLEYYYTPLLAGSRTTTTIRRLLCLEFKGRVKWIALLLCRLAAVRYCLYGGVGWSPPFYACNGIMHIRLALPRAPPPHLLFLNLMCECKRMGLGWRQSEEQKRGPIGRSGGITTGEREEEISPRSNDTCARSHDAPPRERT